MSNTTNTQHKPWKIAVVKFCGSLLPNLQDISLAVHEIYQYLREGYRVLAVVSAMDDKTDKLGSPTVAGLDEDGFIPPANEFAELLATGETAAACLFTIGLDRAGIKAKKLNHHCLITKNSLLNSEPDSFTTDLVITLFERYSVLVLPGAIGYDDAKRTTLLGRKGADYAAIYAAWHLHADECVIYQDTDGIYEKKLTVSGDGNHRYETLDYTDLLKLHSSIIHHKALKFAQAKGVNFTVTSLASTYKTEVGNLPTVFSKTTQPAKKLNIVLLGLGPIGFGVYTCLLAYPHLFNIVGIGVKDVKKHERKQLPAALLSNDWKALLTRGCDVAIELMGEHGDGEAVIRQALLHGHHVITANRALIAAQGQALSQLAKQNNAQLLYSACLGGAIPILENLRKINDGAQSDPIQSISGVLDSTCNFILDKVKDGQTLNNTISLTKILGVAESKSTLDLYGVDATQKAILLSRTAFGRDPDTIEMIGIQRLDETSIHDAQAAGKNIRLVVSCVLENKQIKVSVEPTAMELSHPLAQVSGMHNAVLIRTQSNRLIELHGKGAGRWPVAESVFGDLLNLSSRIRRNQLHINAINFVTPEAKDIIRSECIEEVV